MINEKALKEIYYLEKVYEKNWGTPVDYTILPPGISQEKLAVVLNRIIETGESILVGWEERPVGFCQYYKCMDVEEDWYGDISLCGTYSIDYLIGEEGFLGKGIGKSIIALLIKEIFSLTDAERIIVQPDEDNKASCNSLLSNGFTFDAKNNVYTITK